MSRPVGFHHTEETKQKLSELMRGELNSMYGVSLKAELNGKWRGGRYQKGGYILIHKPKHPFCDKDGYVFEHRLILEEMLDRYLLPSEISHHLNGIKDDNRPKNLAIYDNHSSHMQKHTMRRQRNAKGQFVAT